MIVRDVHKLQEDCSKQATYNMVFAFIILALMLFVPELEMPVRGLGIFLAMTRMQVAKLFYILAKEWDGEHLAQG